MTTLEAPQQDTFNNIENQIKELTDDIKENDKIEWLEWKLDKSFFDALNNLWDNTVVVNLYKSIIVLPNEFENNEEVQNIKDFLEPIANPLKVDGNITTWWKADEIFYNNIDQAKLAAIKSISDSISLISNLNFSDANINNLKKNLTNIETIMNSNPPKKEDVQSLQEFLGNNIDDTSANTFITTSFKNWSWDGKFGQGTLNAVQAFVGKSDDFIKKYEKSLKVQKENIVSKPDVVGGNKSATETKAETDSKENKAATDSKENKINNDISLESIIFKNDFLTKKEKLNKLFDKIKDIEKWVDISGNKNEIEKTNKDIESLEQEKTKTSKQLQDKIEYINQIQKSTNYNRELKNILIENNQRDIVVLKKTLVDLDSQINQKKVDKESLIKQDKKTDKKNEKKSSKIESKVKDLKSEFVELKNQTNIDMASIKNQISQLEENIQKIDMGSLSDTDKKIVEEYKKWKQSEIVELEKTLNNLNADLAQIDNFLWTDSNKGYLDQYLAKIEPVKTEDKTKNNESINSSGSDVDVVIWVEDNVAKKDIEAVDLTNADVIEKNIKDKYKSLWNVKEGKDWVYTIDPKNKRPASTYSQREATLDTYRAMFDEFKVSVDTDEDTWNITKFYLNPKSV